MCSGGTDQRVGDRGDQREDDVMHVMVLCSGGTGQCVGDQGDCSEDGVMVLCSGGTGQCADSQYNGSAGAGNGRNTRRAAAGQG